MKAQEAFDKVVKFAAKQGKRAMDEEGWCRYRAPDGTCCFVGARIPDDLYRPEMERMPFIALIREYKELVPFFELEGLTKSEWTEFWKNCSAYMMACSNKAGQGNLKYLPMNLV